MTDSNISLHPDWAAIPDDCPVCNREFHLSGAHRAVSYDEGSSDHGEYTEATCLSCDAIIDRHYDDPDANAEDSFVKPDLWVFKAQDLELHSNLRRRESQVRALKEQNLSHAEISNVLGISESTVGEYSRRINTRLDEAEHTVAQIGHTTDFSSLLESVFEGFPAPFTQGLPCENCGGTIGEDERARIVLEYVSRGWEPRNVYCLDCDRAELMMAVHGKALSLDEFMEESRDLNSQFAIVTAGRQKPDVDTGRGQSGDIFERGVRLVDVSLEELLN
jgi:hypothetical protein